MSDLERVFPVNHEYHARIFYDRREGKYYDQATDLYLEWNELRAYGLGV